MLRITRQVLVGAALLMLTHQPSMAQDGGGREAIDFLKTACAAGESFEIVATADGGISFLRKGPSGGLEGSVTYSQKDLRGAVGYLKEELRKTENDRIRACMEPRIDRILSAILKDNQMGPGPLKVYDYDDARISVEWAGIPRRTEKTAAVDLTLRNNTDKQTYVLIVGNSTSMMMRAVLENIGLDVIGIAYCGGGLDTQSCERLDFAQWTLLQPRDSVRFKIKSHYELHYDAPPSELSLNLRLLMSDGKSAHYRDFSFPDIPVR